MVKQEEQDEIKTHYRGCLDPEKQIEILCELFPHLKKSEILEVLGGGDKCGKAVKKQENKENNSVASVIRSYEQNVQNDVCRAILIEGLSYSEAAERFGVPCGNISRWVSKAKAQQKEYLDCDTSKKFEGCGGQTTESTVKSEPEQKKGNDLKMLKANTYASILGRIRSFGILDVEEMELLAKIIEKVEIFEKGYRYAKEARHDT